MCFGRIGQNGGDNASRIAGCVAFHRMMANSGDGVSSRSTGSNIDWNGWLALIARFEKATPSEVMGLPSWTVASLRSVSSNERPSSWNAQLSARSGRGVQPSSKRSGLAKIWAAGIPVAPPDCTAEFRCLGAAR